MKLDVVFFL